MHVLRVNIVRESFVVLLSSTRAQCNALISFTKEQCWRCEYVQLHASEARLGDACVMFTRGGLSAGQSASASVVGRCVRAVACAARRTFLWKSLADTEGADRTTDTIPSETYITRAYQRLFLKTFGFRKLKCEHEFYYLTHCLASFKLYIRYENLHGHVIWNLHTILYQKWQR